VDAESFGAWHRSDLQHRSHELIPRESILDPSFTSLTVGNNIEDPDGIQNLGEAIEVQPVALSRWLMESDAVFALLLSADGTIRVRNRASQRVFAPHSVKNTGLSIWEYLSDADAQHLRERLSDDLAQRDSCLLLNLSPGQETPITVEVGLIRCGEEILLLGAGEQHHDTAFQAELIRLTNDLSVMVRKSAQNNRELRAANESIERLARTDALTGLANRRTLEEVAYREIARVERFGEGLSVILADLDGFKSINDQYGHIIGDQVLARAAEAFGKRLRPYDLAARYGGEEFLLLLPGTSICDAVTIAERIRSEVAKVKVSGFTGPITISLGVANWMTGETSEQLFARADAALYKAKNSGRNRVEAAANILV
jgi:diguanylate cyclase (GGDEF)-like protein